jgi:hypothetical protein
VRLLGIFPLLQNAIPVPSGADEDAQGLLFGVQLSQLLLEILG